ncbi:breast carcinoma amplified sequence 2 [Exidia glandulosa HHB12029]|uniref:Breast carcinoma amplified sequence 2 n=1 Tax=Exidia glandulosa HHB12029 TaxID=1314781 RepID=A0A165PEA8_EXIGL|nr:breast carcinoma amplified sequence 2 [Exidia glandulosa HHB12029]
MAAEHDTVDIFDSLPYFDRDLELFPDLKRKVDAELAREAGKTPKQLHPKLPPPATLFEKNPLLAAELARIEAHKPIPPIDTTRYQLPPPPSGQDASEEAWQKALDNAKAQLTHQELRQSNLALLQTYGANAWRLHNYLLEADAKVYEAALEKLREETTELNRERKNYQTRAGQQLSSLETKWTELMSNLLQIEVANTAMEAEIYGLHQREQELQADLGASSA